MTDLGMLCIGILRTMQYNKIRAFVILKGHICVGSFFPNSNIYITVCFFFTTQLHTYFTNTNGNAINKLYILSFNLGLSILLHALEYQCIIVQHGIVGVHNFL